jgi:O-antigen/teichoic acid export membrane protein
MSLLGRGQPREAAEVRRLFTTFGYLVARQGATAVIGLIYWAVVTHLFDARDVGLAAAAASTGLLLAAFGALGVPLLLLAEIETIEATKRRVIFTTGLAIAGAVVLILAIGTMALSPLLGKSLKLIGEDPVTAALFIVGAVATMAGLTLDNLAIGLHRGDAQLWRGSLSSILKLACVGVLVLASTRTSAGLIFAWTLSLVISFLVCIPMLRLERTPSGEGTISSRVAIVRRFGKLSLQHHVLNLSIGLASFIVPLTATLIITPPEVAYFSAAFLLSATLLIIPYLLALSLFAERSGDPGLLHRHVRHTLPVGIALSGAIVLVVEFAAPYALRLFGPAYAANGTTALRILILVGPAYVIKDHYVSIRRAQGRLSHAAKIMALGTTAEVSGAALGGLLWGLTGICAGWAVAASCEAVFLLPAVLEVFRPTQGLISDTGADPE